MEDKGCGHFPVGEDLTNVGALRNNGVGNYGEVFDRNLGKASPLGMARGENALWKDGGLMYAPPMP